MQPMINAPQNTLQPIRSYVLRATRMSQRQKQALEQLWPIYGCSSAIMTFNLTTYFQREAPTILEIGFGMGATLLTMAEQAPEKNFIGIEVHKPGLGALLAGIAEKKIKNIRVFQDDATDVLKNNIPDSSLDAVWIFFPDPWPKKRHHKRRLVQTDFVNLIQQKLKIGGQLHMATDVQDYAEQMLRVTQAIAGLKNTAPDHTYVPRPAHRPLTKFEQRGQKLGHGIWDLIFSKTNS